MWYSKRYIIFTAVLCGALALKFNNIGEKYKSVEAFRGASLEDEVWNPLIAETVNGQNISITIDNRSYSSREVPMFMDDNRNLMIPVDILRDSFNCSAHVYDGTSLLVEKYTSRISFVLGDDRVYINNEPKAVESGLIEKDGTYYVSAQSISDSLGYSFEWNMEKNSALSGNMSSNSSVVPPSYDLRKQGRVSAVKDQGTYGTCWAFAALSAMESTLLPEEEMELSPDHMTLQNSFRITQKDGGDYTMGMAYLAAWQGPVYEKDDPYGDNVSDDTLTAVKHVQEMQVIESKDFEKIKEAVFKYGGVQTSIYNALRSSQSKSEYYDRETNSYCYIGTEKPNHDVVIIGWDDNYPKENFNAQLEGDGAFICQNSWGEGFGEDGVFYVSYYDTNIGIHNVVYTKIEDTDNYDHIYQSDLCGWVGQLGYGQETAYGANVYTAGTGETLEAVGFYATGEETEYKVYVVKNYENEGSLINGKKVAEGTFTNAGYYTVKLNEPVDLADQEKFAVMIQVTTPDSIHPLAVEYQADAMTEAADISDGEGYISMNGASWDSIEKSHGCNLCLKAFTGNEE